MTPGHRGGEEADSHRYGSGNDPEYDRYRAAVDALADPLNDPLPGQRPPEPEPSGSQPERHPHARPPEPPPSGSSPSSGTPGPSGPRARHGAAQQPPGPQTAAGSPYAADAGQEAAWYAAAPYEPYTGPAQPQPPQPPPSGRSPRSGRSRPGAAAAGAAGAGDRARAARFVRGPAPNAGPESGRYDGGGQQERDDRSTVGLRRPRAEEFPPRSRTERPPGPTRLEARRAARALRPGPRHHRQSGPSARCSSPAVC
ncbi:hypothetical protein IHE61_06075 [Streptomyces sp. GKU 257-1]|nr:hypothetical protein [Streptomyces sp. GKU 257-1]